MIISDEIEIKINSKDLYLREYGYSFELRELLYVKVEHLSENSSRKIDVKCDI